MENETDDKYTRVPGREYFYRSADNLHWKRCGQGRYNLMKANGYLVMFTDVEQTGPKEETFSYEMSMSLPMLKPGKSK